jgi:hypothetical protein
MKKSKLIEIESVVQILFERNNRAKYIRISVKPFTRTRSHPDKKSQ